jgi:myosin V
VLFTDELVPTVLQAIRLRYFQKEIYTYSGIVLIATNPFARVDSLYVPGMVQVYAGRQRATQAPHLFAIAEEAFAYVKPAARIPPARDW